MRRGGLGTRPTLATLGDALPGRTRSLGTAQSHQNPPRGKAADSGCPPGAAPSTLQLLCPWGDGDAADGDTLGWSVPSAPRVRSSSKLAVLLPHPARQQSLGTPRAGDKSWRPPCPLPWTSHGLGWALGTLGDQQHLRGQSQHTAGTWQTQFLWWDLHRRPATRAKPWSHPPVPILGG